MKNLDILLYRYMAICANHILQHALAVTASLAPSLVYRPALQRARTPMIPRTPSR